MNIGHLSYVLALIAALLTSVFCTPAAAQRLKEPCAVAFVDFTTREASTAFQRFVASVNRVAEAKSASFFCYLAANLDQPEQMRRDIQAFTQRSRALLVAPNSHAASIIHAAAPQAPMIFAGYSDPVADGLAKSMAAPGDHVTGVYLGDLLDEKRLELLMESASGVRRIAVLTDRYWLNSNHRRQRLIDAARGLGIEMQFVYANDEHDVDQAMHAPQARQVDAWYVPPTRLSDEALEPIIRNLRQLAKPAIFSTSAAVGSGAQMSYVMDFSGIWETLASLTLRVLAGEDPGSIPIERPRKFILSVRTGPETNVPPISPNVIRRADRIY